MTDALNVSQYFVPFLIALGVSIVCTLLVRKLSIRAGILDDPSDDTGRKIHTQPVPLLGGLALFFSFSVVLWGYALFTDQVFGGYMLPKYLGGITIGGLLLMIGGFLDDRFHLTARRQIIWPVLAALTIIASGIGVSYLRNPFGDSIDVTRWAVTLFSFDGLPYRIVLLADAFAFIWLMGMMYTTKFLDGLDGLVSGITTIGSFVLFFLSLSREVAQPETALLAIILAGVSLGFLVFNFHPARIFLGEGGSLWTGFLLGTIAIISGAKIATALLIFGIPILDVAWVILRRLLSKKSIVQADRQHLHFRLLDVGFSHRQAVIFLWIVTAGFGTAALFLQGKEKAVSLAILVGLMAVLAAALVLVYQKRKGTPT